MTGRVLFLVAVAAFAGTSLGHAAEVQRRDRTAFYLSEWPGQPRHFDVPPGGMSDFLSRLSYPKAWNRPRVEGVVWVQVSLDAKGRLLAVRILRSKNSVFDDIVIGAARHTRWTPALKNGRPVAAKFRFPVTFKLSRGRP